MMSNYNIFNGLEKFGDSIALETETEKISYTQLNNLATKFFNEHKIFERALVFLVCKNSVQSIVNYVVCLKNNAVPVLINANINHDLLERLKDLYKPNFIVRENEVTALNLNHHAINQDTAILLTTSGSTGSPKFVKQSYKNIFANTKSICEYLKISPNDKAITTMPMSYTYGLSILQTHLFSGACVFVTEKNFFSRDFWNIMREKKISTFGAVPYTYEMLDKLRFFKMDLPDLKYVTQAGGHLNADLQKKFAEGFKAQGKNFIVMYGAAEATARMSYVPAEFSTSKIGSIGVAIPGGKFELVDDDGKIIAQPETAGELVYYGDNVTLGYAENYNDLAKPDENHGRLLTGDIAKFDAEGFFYIQGRKKRFLKIFGNRINLAELEEILRNNNFECACAGVDDHLKIYTTNSDENVTNEIKSLAEKTTHLNHSAFEVKFIKTFPRNEAGKILYSELN